MNVHIPLSIFVSVFQLWGHIICKLPDILTSNCVPSKRSIIFSLVFLPFQSKYKIVLSTCMPERKIDQLAPGQGHALAVHFDIVVAAIFDFMTEEDWKSRNRNP